MNFLVNKVRTLCGTLMHPFVRFGRSTFNINSPYLILGSPNYHTFIGYYDIQPFNRDRSKLLAARCCSFHNGRAMDAPLEIGYFDLKTQKFTTIGTTNLWNWQMSCRLQWANWFGEELILYNDLVNKQPSTVVYDPVKKEVHTVLPLPTFSISSDGKQIASVDFNHLEHCRNGYGYDWQEGATPKKESCLLLVDVETGKQKVVTQTLDLRSLNYASSMSDENAVHYFNHVHFNPSCTHILFFHIWNAHGRRFVRALTMTTDGKDIKDITGSDHVSHYWWLNDDEILLYCTDLKHGLGYHIYNKSGEHIKHLKKNIPNLDGHPCSNGFPWFICDNVVNKHFERNLWFYDIEKEQHTMLAQFYSPPKFSGPNRCDLHPRLSQDSHLVAVDSAHDGFRQIVVLDISRFL